MSEINPFTPKEADQGHSESNVFLDLNKPDEATGIPSLSNGFGSDASSGGAGFSPRGGDSNKFNGQVLLAGLVFAIGVGSIYAMRYIGMQAGIKESVKMVDYTASTTTPDFVERFESVMQDLEEVSQSVRFEEGVVMPSTPFMMAAAEEEVVEMAPMTATEDPAEYQARLARQQAQREREDLEARQSECVFKAEKLVLQSVIGGSRPVARISGEPVGVGMVVDDTFKVISIKGSTVTLEALGLRFELGLGAGATRID